jgi:hypothetical protein
MAEPVAGSEAVVAAVARLVGELARLGYTAWKSNRAGKQKLVGILIHIQDELNRNYKSLQDAYNGSDEEQLETAAYETAIEALGQALYDSPSVLDPLRRAYQLITPGMQARMKRVVHDEAKLAELGQLWAFTGQASYEIDKWFAHEGVLPARLSKEECAYRMPHELMGGWPPSERLRVFRKWREFRDARRIGNAAEYTLNELGFTTVYAAPERELEFREYGRSAHGWLHSFELVEHVYELWLDPSLRVLYLCTNLDPVLLDVVRLSGRDQDGWTPKWYLDRARCRAESWRHALS